MKEIKKKTFGHSNIDEENQNLLQLKIIHSK